MRLRNFMILFFALVLTTSLLHAQTDTTKTKDSPQMKKPVVCTVTKDYNVKDKGPANGWIIYKKPAASGQSEDSCWQYLEAAPVDSTRSIWSNVTDKLVGGTSTGVGNGQDNTNKIIAQPGHTASAAKECSDLVVKYNGQTFKGWVLPSQDELELMYHLLKKKNNIGGFNNGFYWSSSENEDGSNLAWFQYFYNGSQKSTYQTNNYKANDYYVRCVRAF